VSPVRPFMVNGSGNVASIFDERAERALRILRDAGIRPVSFAELTAAGIPNPASVIYELELAGHVIEHLPAGVRLLDQSEPPPARRTRHRITLRPFRDTGA
jgi:hypothetical protein